MKSKLFLGALFAMTGAVAQADVAKLTADTNSVRAGSVGVANILVELSPPKWALKNGYEEWLKSEKVVEALEKIAAGELYISERVRARMLSRLVNNRTGEVTSPVESLSDREMEVFQLIGNGYATRQIAERLNLSVKTIDSYREHLKLKLNLDSGADLVRYAIQWVKSQDSV